MLPWHKSDYKIEDGDFETIAGSVPQEPTPNEPNFFLPLLNPHLWTRQSTSATDSSIARRAEDFPVSTSRLHYNWQPNFPAWSKAQEAWRRVAGYEETPQLTTPLGESLRCATSEERRLSFENHRNHQHPDVSRNLSRREFISSVGLCQFRQPIQLNPQPSVWLFQYLLSHSQTGAVRRQEDSESEFFSSASTAPQNSAAESALNKLFDKYRDDPSNSPDQIFIQGAMNYFKDINISIEDVGVLLVSELLACPTLGEITRQGFVSGWSSSGASTVAAQRAHLTSLIKELPKPDSRAQGGRFRRVYKHTFKLACPQGSKSVPLETASEFWKILFSEQGMLWVTSSGTQWLDHWLVFLQEKWKKAVNRDLWDQTLLFALKTLEDDTLSWWNEESAWPGIIDGFVEYCKEGGIAGYGGKGNVSAMEVD